MPMMTDAALRRAMQVGQAKVITDPGRRGDGRLVAMVRPAASGALVEFYARQIQAGRKRLVKLGTYPGTSLAQARQAFKGMSPAIRDGENLRVHRDRARTERAALGTLLDLCEGYAASLEADGRRSGREVRRALIRCDDSPVRHIGGHRPACEVTPGDVAEWLRPIYRRGTPVAAKQARAWLSAAYTWGLRRENDYTIEQPHRWGLKVNPAIMVPAHNAAQRGNTRHLSVDEFRAVWQWLQIDAGRSDTRACNAIRIIMATGQRVEEILHLRAGQYADGWLRWGDTKNGRQRGVEKPHGIPLPRQVLPILDSMPANRHGLLVPGFKRIDEPYMDRSLNWIARRCAKMLGIPQFTPRDLRRTWRTLAGDLGGLNAEECARIMNHAYGSKVEADHYDRGDNAPVKLAGMAKWEAALDKLIGVKVEGVPAPAIRAPAISSGLEPDQA